MSLILPPTIDLDHDDDNDDDNDIEKQKPYTNLSVNGQDYDLEDPDDAQAANDRVRQYREQLKEHDLSTYDDKPTKWGGGGRSELLYDELRSKLAVDFHRGLHDLSWTDQHKEAERIVGLRAQQTRGVWLKG